MSPLPPKAMKEWDVTASLLKKIKNIQQMLQLMLDIQYHCSIQEVQCLSNQFYI